ncbi:MAG TPA: hypothetical protein G4O00_05880 [Thermoflexia bacterium]|nr:hypothetical protein [Thermoflexia bacterium]
MRPLEQHLIRCDPIRLSVIAERWGVDLPRGPRRERAAALAERMTGPERIGAVWERLGEAERRALSDLLAEGGRLPWQTFVRFWGEVRTMGPARLERERPWEDPVSPAEALWYWGLVFQDLAEGPAGLVEVAVVPEELRPYLPAPPPPVVQPTPCPPPPIVHPADDGLLDDACTLLAYLQNHRLRPGPEGEWPARDEARLLRRFRDDRPDRFGFLCHLAHRLGWLRTDEAGHLRPDPETVIGWLRGSAWEQRRSMAQAWREDPTWNDLWHVPTLRPDDTGSWRNNPVLAREAILRHLAACKPDTWYALETFIAAIKEIDPDFQRPDGDYSTWYIRDASTGQYLSGFESWDAVEGALIRYLITGPMSWLGLVDLGADRDGEPPTVFRLSPDGAAFLGRGEPPVRPEPPPLVVRPDLTVLAPPGRRYERFQLSRVADWVRTGDPYLYRITPTSLERARRQRISLERIVAFLEEATGGEVPRTLRPALARWARRGAEVRLTRGILLRVRDESLLRELTSAPATRRYIREVLGPTAALVAPGDWPRLAQALVERGVLPDVEVGEGGWADWGTE